MAKKAKKSDNPGVQFLDALAGFVEALPALTKAGPKEALLSAIGELKAAQLAAPPAAPPVDPNAATGAAPQTDGVQQTNGGAGAA